MMDATIVRVHQHGLGTKRGKTNRRSDVPVEDALGNPFRFELTGDEAHDSIYGYEMLKAMN
ncbi:hypothetical protein IAQ67_12425 [Paenibacillus peoriae]|uniref:Transposase n=1 Tax=Paenibacillus peoriae TaxID=59893 RepID=A0A7H0YF78_9BACL|nr:hypothetical protein [Paenibacillus peoriae]QNR69736.1 hypothetical protein IAQ67_12425 [Paenibacillus peoriae]